MPAIKSRFSGAVVNASEATAKRLLADPAQWEAVQADKPAPKKAASKSEK